jgi:uncharacterized membrane protein
MTVVHRPIRRSRLATIGAIVAMLAALALAPAAADEHAAPGEANRCYGVQGQATTTFDPAVGGFTGVASFRIGGQRQDVPAAAFVTGPASTSHEFAFEQGTIVTDDQLILRPIDPAAGLFELRTRLQVVDGGSGKLHILPGSTLDLATGTAAWEMRGHVCFD